MKKASLTLDFPYERLLKWTSLIGTFLLGQGALQLIQVFSGLLLVRWLSVEGYAQYSMAFAFQCTAHVLVEFGFSGTIIALVGNRIHDKKVIGNYIKAGQYYRNRLFLFISIFCLVIFPLITAKHNWSIFATIMLLVSIISNLFFTGWTSYYTPPLRMHQRIGLLYKIQIKSGIIRLITLCLMYFVTILNSWLAALIGSLQTLMNGFLIKKASGVYIDEPEEVDLLAQKEMVNIIKPLMPGIIFTAFQSQIMIFIISIFGQTNDIAEIGALSRIGQLYAVFSMAGGVLIAPYLARLPIKGLAQKFSLIVGGGILFCGLIVILGYFFPMPLLWIMGNKYDHLTNELILLLVSSGLGLLNGLIWEMSESRKWIYGWDPISIITGTIVIQIICMLAFDLSSIHDLLLLTILTNLFVFFVRIFVTVYGFTINYKNA